MIPQGGGFQGCYLDNHRNNWRCARAVHALCPRCARAVRKRPLSHSGWLRQLLQLTSRDMSDYWKATGVQPQVSNARRPTRRSRVRTRCLTPMVSTTDRWSVSQRLSLLYPTASQALLSHQCAGPARWALRAALSKPLVGDQVASV